MSFFAVARSRLALGLFSYGLAVSLGAPGAYAAPCGGATSTGLEPAAEQIHALFLALGDRSVPGAVVTELRRPGLNGKVPQVILEDVPMGGPARPGKPAPYNPLGGVPKDFNVGSYLVLPGETSGTVPEIPAYDRKYFAEMRKLGKRPRFFMWTGHHVNSQGPHDDAGTRHFFKPTWLKLIETDENAKWFFENVEFALVFGCDGLSNFEPHGPNGEYLRADQIEQMYRQNPASVIGPFPVKGPIQMEPSLEYYRRRQVQDFGITNQHGHYEYTRGPKAEDCRGPLKYQDCEVTNVDRIWPNVGLWDGTHRFNEPMTTKRLFPNAHLVLGFGSAMASSVIGGRMLNETFRRARAALAAKGQKVDNLLHAIVDPKTPEPLRRSVIEEVRKQWAETGFTLNRQRPGAAITPAHPDLDMNGPFNHQPAGSRVPLKAPYEDRTPVRAPAASTSRLPIRR